MPKVGIVGASGYTGAELLRLCAGHPSLEVVTATGDTQAGRPVAALYPHLAKAYPDLVLDTYDPRAVDGLDLAFLALPHGASQDIAPDLVDRVAHVVDLSADFRLADAELYPTWYGHRHTRPEVLAEAAYGLPELFRDEIRGSRLVAAAGCYPTATALALAPLVKEGVVEVDGVVVDAASGVSGAGRPPKPNTTFCAVDEDFTAYGLLDHRHTPEIEQTLIRLGGQSASVLFTPHLAPMNRGILATCYARPAGSPPGSSEELLDLSRDFYADEPFVVVTEEPPSTKATLGSNVAHVTVRYDARTGWVLAIAALDNLVKGASGQAIQCANLLMGLDESAGLPDAGMYP